MDAPVLRGDDTVAGSLSEALKQLKDQSVPESESLVTLLGHISAAFEYTVEPNERYSVAYHCREALRIIEAFQSRPRGEVPDEVATCLTEGRGDLEQALQRVDSRSGSGTASAP